MCSSDVSSTPLPRNFMLQDLLNVTTSWYFCVYCVVAKESSLCHFWSSCFQQKPIFLFTSVRTLHSFYLFLSLRLAIPFSNQCHTFVKRKFFHRHAREIFVTFDRYVLTALRNVVAESIPCRRRTCSCPAFCSRRLCHWILSVCPFFIRTFISLKYNYVRSEVLEVAMIMEHSTL
jgi:hypothetical protein